MSWYGSHPKITLAESKRILPPGACKRCVYWFACVIGSSPQMWFGQKADKCERCGIDRAESLAKAAK